MLEFMHQDVSQIVVVPLKQESGKYNGRPMQLPTEWAMRPIANKNDRQLLRVNTNVRLAQQFSHFACRHLFAFSQGTP
jgi:hypothetical protein